MLSFHALFVLFVGFVEVVFAEAFDFLLVFISDFCGIRDAVGFIVAIHEFGGRLESWLAGYTGRQDWGHWDIGGRAYLFGKALEIVLWDLIFVFIDEWLDVGE